MARALLPIPLVFALTACLHPDGPERVAAEYRQAWQKGDVEALRALSDRGYRTRVDADRLQALVDGPAGRVAHAQTSTASPTAARLSFSDGVELELVLEGEQWRVRRGGADPDRAEDPIGALRRFLGAALVADLDEVRSFMPLEARARFVDDAALRAHLEDARDRLRDVLHALSSGRAELSETEAEATVSYGPGRAARLTREEGQWRVLDLE